MRAIIVSDVHLRGANDPRQTEFIRFVEGERDSIDHFWIVGDLLDLWFGMKPVLVREYYPVLSLLRRLSASNTKVHYLEGNHDFNLRPYIEDSVGAEVLDRAECEWAGRKVLLTHGDGIDPADVKYRLLKRIVRSSAFRVGVRVLPGRLLWRLGLRFSQVSRAYLGREHPQWEAQKEFARQRILEGYDVVVLGHAHVPGLFPTAGNGRNGLYVNVGDWLTHFSYIDVRDGRFELRTVGDRPLAPSVRTKEEVE